MLFVVAPGAILIGILVFTLLVNTILRGYQIPQCFLCGANKVRPSRPLGLLDSTASLFLIRCYRCSGCLSRFRAIRLFGRSGVRELQ